MVEERQQHIAPFTTNGKDYFSKSLSQRQYQRLIDVRQAEINKHLSNFGLKSEAQRKLDKISKIGYSEKYQFALPPPQDDNDVFGHVKVELSIEEKRDLRMRAALWKLHDAILRRGLEQWIHWLSLHRAKFGMEPTLANIAEYNRNILETNQVGSGRAPGRTVKIGDIVLFRCSTAPLDGSLPPMHAVPCHKTEALIDASQLVIGLVEHNSQARRTLKQCGLYSLLVDA